MRESWFQRVLSRRLLSLAFVVLCTGLVLAPTAAQAEPLQGQPQSRSGDVPLSFADYDYGHNGDYSNYGGHAAPNPMISMPAVYDPALLAAYYNVDPSVVAASTLPYYQWDGQANYDIDLASLEQERRHGLNASGVRQEYLTEPGLDPYRQVSAFGGAGDGRGGPAPQGVPTLSYNAPGGVSVYGRPDPNHGAGGMRFSPATPPWLTGFDTGVYVNDDQVLFTLGGTLKLWEGTHSVLAARLVASGATYHNGPSKAGWSLDVWGASRVETLGVGHLVKIGGLWDQQEDLRRGGFTVGAVLFPEIAKAPPTFDLAFGFGGGSEFFAGRFREVADFDAQIRMGFIFFDILRVGGSLQYWEWNNPALDRSAGSAGGYVQVDLGQWMITGDVQATRENAQGFLNFVWMPGRHHAPLHSHHTINVSSTKTKQRYQHWMTSAPIRDLAMRTGERVPDSPNAAVSFAPRVGNITNVSCTVALTTDAGTVGIVDPDDVYSVTVTFVNSTPADASPTPSATDGVLYQNVTVTGPGTTTVGASAPITVPASSAVQAAQVIPVTVDTTAVAGDQIFIQFEVISDGQIGRFICGPVTVGAAPPAAMSATFQGYVLPPTP